MCIILSVQHFNECHVYLLHYPMHLISWLFKINAYIESQNLCFCFMSNYVYQ